MKIELEAVRRFVGDKLGGRVQVMKWLRSLVKLSIEVDVERVALFCLDSLREA